MNDQLEINKIKEIYPGHYFTLLDFPTTKDLYNILDLSYKYVWCFSHRECAIEWEKYSYTLFEKPLPGINVEVRNMEFEYLISTADFVNMIPNINQSVNIIQTNVIPPSYLNLKKMEGKSRYKLLKEKVDYLFELEMPGAADYAPIVSPNKDFLKGIIERIKWD